MRLAVCAAGEIWGGVERFIVTLATGLRSLGIDLLVVLFYDGPLAAALREQRIAVKTLAGFGKYDPRIGSCADTGHWPRSGLDPVDAITKLKGRIMSSHLKETDKIGQGARDIVYGTTQMSRTVKDQLAAFKSVGFRGPLSLEYEAGKKGQELLDDLKVMVKVFDEVTTELAK